MQPALIHAPAVGPLLLGGELQGTLGIGKLAPYDFTKRRPYYILAKR
jgi:hypothetical protein